MIELLSPLTSNTIIILLRVNCLRCALWLLWLVDRRWRLRSWTTAWNQNWSRTNETHWRAGSMSHHVDCAAVLVVKCRLQYLRLNVHMFTQLDLYSIAGGNQFQF